MSLVDAYFQCKPESLDGFKMVVMPDGDVLALDVLSHAKEIYRDADKIICHVRLSDDEIQELAYQANTFNPLDISSVQAIGITWTYLGRALAGVFERYPELEGLLMEHIWL